MPLFYKPFFYQFFQKGKLEMNIIVENTKKSVLSSEILKSHLRIANNIEDDYLNEIISMATDILEKNIEKPILRKKYKYIHSNDKYVSTRRILLPMCFVTSIISVKKVVSSNKRENIDYSVEDIGERTYVITNGTRYPIEIIYTAGITDKPDEIPKDLQFAVLQIAKNIYECSEEDILESKYIKHIVNSNRSLYIN